MGEKKSLTKSSLSDRSSSSSPRSVPDEQGDFEQKKRRRGRGKGKTRNSGKDEIYKAEIDNKIKKGFHNWICSQNSLIPLVYTVMAEKLWEM